MAVNIPVTISGIKEAKKDLQELGDQFDKFKNDPIESAKIAKQFNKLQDEIHQTEEAFDELNKSGKHLTATFEEIYGEGIQPMTSRIGELEDRMYELALAGQQNTKEFKDMAVEAGRLRQTIIDTDKQVDFLAENRGLSVVSTGFRQVGDSLLRLDFEGAAMDAKALNAAMTNLGTRGAKAIKGLGQTVVQLGKTFVKMGVALLANPIFLMAAVVTALVAAIIALMNELGLLQPILDAISEAFQFVKEILMGLVQALKDFSDWLGITKFAMKDLANEYVNDTQKVIDRTEELQATITERYDHEIRLARIAGEDTTELEIKKQKGIRATAVIRQKALEKQLEAAKIAGQLDEEGLKKIEDQLKAVNKLIKTTDREIEAINAQRDADEDKRRTEQLAKDKASYQKRLAEKKAFEQERLRVERQIQDLELQLQEEGLQKEIDTNATKYARLIEDVENNEKLLAEERTRLIALYSEQELEARKEIELKYQKQVQDAVDAANKERKEKEEQERLEALERQKEFNQMLLEADRKINEERLAEEKAQAEARIHLKETLIGTVQDLEQSLAAAGVRTAGLQKVLALVDIATSTAKAISNVVAGATAAAAAGGPAAPFLIGGYIAAGIASVASAIASAKAALQDAPSIGGSASSSVNVGGVVSAQPAQPSFELFGQNNDANNLGEAPEQDQTQNINVTAMVSEVELTAKQKKQAKIQESATL